MPRDPAVPLARSEVRVQIVEAALALLRDGGAGAVTTRRVADAAGVQAPTIYRLFGDKDGLLDAVAEHAMALHVADKRARRVDDPVEALRLGWQSQIDFGVTHPELTRLMNARSEVSPAVRAGVGVLEARVHALATAGLLTVSEERAVGLIHAAGVGAVQATLETPPDLRDPGLADALFDAVLRQIARPRPTVGASTDTAVPDTATITVQFRTLVPALPAMSAAERALMLEWLDRSIRAAERP